MEVHKEAQPLYGYQGDVREQKAHVIIRRQFVGTAANDIGFERQPNGSYRVWVSEFDQSHNKYDDTWLGLLKQGYGIEKVRKEAKKKGFRFTEQKQDDGRVRLVLQEVETMRHLDNLEFEIEYRIRSH